MIGIMILICALSLVVVVYVAGVVALYVYISQHQVVHSNPNGAHLVGKLMMWPIVLLNMVIN